MSEPVAPAAPAAKAAPAAAPKAAPVAKAPVAALAAKAAPVSVSATSFKRQLSLAGPEPVEAPAEIEPEADPLESDAPEPVVGDEPQGEPDPDATDPDAVDPDAIDPDAPEAAPESEYPAEIHGVPTKDLIAALLEGKIPEALLDKLTIECIDGDERWVGDLNKLRNGAQMHSSFTKKSMALAEDKKKLAGESQALAAERDELYQMVRSWKDPKQLKRSARELGLPLHEVAIMWAEEYDKRSKLPAEVVAEMDALEARELELEKRARDIRAQDRKLKEAEQGRNQNENTAKGDGYVKFINGLLPDVFKSVGISTSAHTEKVIIDRFKECLGVFWPDNTEPTKEMVFAAAQATAELLGVQKGASPAPTPAAKSPAAAQVAALQAKTAAPAARKPQALAGSASYDPGKASSPARKALSARGMQEALRKARTGR